METTRLPYLLGKLVYFWLLDDTRSNARLPSTDSTAALTVVKRSATIQTTPKTPERQIQIKSRRQRTRKRVLSRTPATRRSCSYASENIRIHQFGKNPTTRIQTAATKTYECAKESALSRRQPGQSTTNTPSTVRRKKQSLIPGVKKRKNKPLSNNPAANRRT